MQDFSLLDWFWAVWGIFSSVVALASMIAALTPTPKDDEFLRTLRTVIEWVALNVGNARR